tara:strand:+ start:1466 stop:2017 length:552 start_codon:yes stop_codon:yes gene_type:complete
MSTNALVAILDKNNTVTSSYVHYDGYTTGVGEMLLENYNSSGLARDLAVTLGYASSLKETVAASHEDRANSDVSETYESYEDFEEMIRESSHLEYVYVWDSHSDKWMVASWTTTKKKFHNGTCFDYEFDYHWNGFEDLVTVYVREGKETAKRMRKLAEEGSETDYVMYADTLEESVSKWAVAA